MIKYKKCKCDDECWEEIVVRNNENYQFKTVIYFHCSCCGTDFRVEDFETRKELVYLKKQNFDSNRHN